MDAACGWCVTSCVSRNTPSCLDSDGNPKHLILNATECTMCSDHVDCSSCVEVLVPSHGNFFLFSTLFWSNNQPHDFPTKILIKLPTIRYATTPSNFCSVKSQTTSRFYIVVNELVEEGGEEGFRMWVDSNFDDSREIHACMQNWAPTRRHVMRKGTKRGVKWG